MAGLLAATIGRLCEGEVNELRHAYDPARTIESYLAAIEGKTAALFATACRVGGIVGDLPREHIDQLTEFGRLYGMAFQIVDDVLDVIATDEQLGKPAGHDIAEGIYNLPVLHALEELGGDLGTLLGGPIDGADLDTARRLVKTSGGRRPQHRPGPPLHRRRRRGAGPLRRHPVGRRAGRRRHPPPRRRRRGPRRVASGRYPRGMPGGREDALVRGLLTGIAAFRWLAWAWMAIVAASSAATSSRAAGRGSPCVLVGAALVVTAVDGVPRPHRPRPAAHHRRSSSPSWRSGFALGAGDDWAFAGDHPQSLGSVWPLAGVLTAGVRWGGRGGAIAGAVVGPRPAVRRRSSRRRPRRRRRRRSDRRPDHASSIAQASSTFVLYALAGGVAGYAAVKLREAERQISMVQAREEVARTLHDGVLQTLAVVQRRATDPDLARLARDQERELREYLFGAEPAGGELGPRLRQAAARFEDHFDARAQVIVADDLPKLAGDRVDALAGAVSEALTNAGKHGGARVGHRLRRARRRRRRVLLGEGRRHRLRARRRRGRRAHPLDPRPHRRRRRPGRGRRQPRARHRGAAVGVEGSLRG